MMAWCFIGADELYALTDDESGATLPREHGPWRLLKSIELTGGDPDEQEAEALIHLYGFCCFASGDLDEDGAQ